MTFSTSVVIIPIVPDKCRITYRTRAWTRLEQLGFSFHMLRTTLSEQLLACRQKTEEPFISLLADVHSFLIPIPLLLRLILLLNRLLVAAYQN